MFTINVALGERKIGQVSVAIAGRIGNTAIQRYNYSLLFNGTSLTGLILHDQSEGAWGLAQKVLRDMLLRYPLISVVPGARNRVRCKHCREVVESLYQHDFRYCSCGKTFVDGGRYYTRTSATGELVALADTELERRLQLLAAHGRQELVVNVGSYELQGECDSRRYVLRNALLGELLSEAEARCATIMAGRPIPGDRYKVRVLAQVIKGSKPRDAEVDWRRLVRNYELRASNEADACEQALDVFHRSEPIGCLDYVEITTSAVPVKEKKHGAKAKDKK